MELVEGEVVITVGKMKRTPVMPLSAGELDGGEIGWARIRRRDGIGRRMFGRHKKDHRKTRRGLDISFNPESESEEQKSIQDRYATFQNPLDASPLGIRLRRRHHHRNDDGEDLETGAEPFHHHEHHHEEEEEEERPVKNWLGGMEKGDSGASDGNGNGDGEAQKSQEQGKDGDAQGVDSGAKPVRRDEPAAGGAGSGGEQKNSESAVNSEE